LRKLTPRKVDKAIALIMESRQSHKDALEYPENEITGSPFFHEQAIKEYDYVLKVLRRVRKRIL
jgi:hypothetical protein